MIIEYYKKRNAKVPSTICFYNGKGTNIIMELGEPQAIDDKWGYSLLAENSDIIRIVEVVPVDEKPKKKKKKKN